MINLNDPLTAIIAFALTGFVARRFPALGDVLTMLLGIKKPDTKPEPVNPEPVPEPVGPKLPLSFPLLERLFKLLFSGGVFEGEELTEHDKNAAVATLISALKSDPEIAGRVLNGLK